MSQETHKLDEVLTAIRSAYSATQAMVAARVDADVAARETIAKIEAALIVSLDGESLRGLPVLGHRTLGLRLDGDVSVTRTLPLRRATLILDQKGMVVLATRFESTVFIQKAPAAMLRASTLEPYLNAVCHALRIHLTNAQDRTVAFIRMSALAGRVASAATDL